MKYNTVDYETHPTSRENTRLYAILFRKIFDLPLTGPVDPLSLLDKLHFVFGNVDYEILPESDFSNNIPAKCLPLSDGSFLIQISETVFDRAYQHNSGGDRMHILHEIVHPFADKIGFKPIYNRALKNKTILPYRSLEWIVKSITGEIMMPYDETAGMSVQELMYTYGVSEQAAKQRQKY